jgi:arabinogalactan endo-1,4-beta-galactosidase
MSNRFGALLFVIVVVPATLRSAGAYDFAFGADLSFLKQAEDNGMVFKDGTNGLPGLQIFRNHGYNWIRLRLFVEPVGSRLPMSIDFQQTAEA